MPVVRVVKVLGKVHSAPAQGLFDLIRVTHSGQQPPRSYADYKINIPENGDLPTGVLLTRVQG